MESSPIPLDVEAPPERSGATARLSLFWRTFFLLAVLLLFSILAWLQTLRVFELEPRVVQSARQIASLVNLSRAALVHADSIARVPLIKTMSEQEGVRIVPREPDDRFVVSSADRLSQGMSGELKSRLGQDTILATSVNDEPGLWVGFTIDGDGYWMLTDRSRLDPPAGTAWIIWLVVATALSLAGAALLAGLINRPLQDLSVAAARVREGNFAASVLSESSAGPEIRAVNMEFNRMARQLARVEQDRAIMLAGISHDLRTPLARLRLEAELSVADTQARDLMAADIEQVNAIITKFMDYARPDQVQLHAVRLADVVARQVGVLQHRYDMRFHVEVPMDLLVQADDVELGRVIANLLENAARYGKTAASGVAEIDIRASAHAPWALIEVRDHGSGADPQALEHLTKAFFRGDVARTSATGAGLGLAIVEKNVQRMGGVIQLRNRASGGLAARIQLRLA
ncbi:MAG: HAMP domain-containing protein [Rhodoferax sp.]|nr:HAMP domain-containing protein [Rhodoferax sp.]